MTDDHPAAMADNRPAASAGSPIRPEAALEIVLRHVHPTPPEPVALEDCLGRVSARSIPAPCALPRFDNSAMDGYALRSSDTTPAPQPLRIVGESSAGHPASRGPEAGEAVRISTGAVIPPGADSVIPLELTSEADGAVLPSRPVLINENLRRAGEDIQAGKTVVDSGAPLGPSEIALLAAFGLTSVECATAPTVAILSSGDELVPRGQPLAAGQIHDSNAISLSAQARRAGARPSVGPRLPDHDKGTRHAIAQHLGGDVLAVCGGVSVGPHDHVKSAFAELGVTQHFWRVALRPGGPVWFGTLDRDPPERPTLVFGLPGNPVSAMVTFRLFVVPTLAAMVGIPPRHDHPRAVFDSSYRKAPGRTNYLRCHLEHADDGRLHARLTSSLQQSHALSSMLGADALAVIPAEREEVDPGELVEIVLL